MTDIKGSTSSVKVKDTRALRKQWDDITCPICMDHPHNAVLLICSSHDKGCRSYICDTSYRHSNCFDRFKKPKVSNTEDNNNRRDKECAFTDLKCPLCRGNVLGWMVAKEVRQYLDQKSRSCSCESCLFSGKYKDLRRHARRMHPTTRPSNIDPLRQQDWNRLEQHTDHDDVLSAVRSAMPGAVMFGDYVIEDWEDSEQEDIYSDEEWLHTVHLFEMLQSNVRPHVEPREVSRTSRAYRRLLELRDHSVWRDDYVDEEAQLPPRRRRRFTREH